MMLFNRFRFADDTFFSKGGLIFEYDKLEHFLFYFFVTFLTGQYVAWFIFSILWEIKDAILPYEKYGWIGGDGFSWKDILMNVIGILFSLFIKGFIL